MDEEQQTLASPLAGSIRGIRRSVSSNVFSGRALPQQVSDPQQTSLLNQNSLTLTNVSSQLSGINERVSNINTSLNAIKENLTLSDELERNRQRAKEQREAQLAEQGLREGKESSLEKKVQFALLTPVRRVANFAKGLLGRLTDFFLVIAGGWLTDQILTFFRLKSEGNLDGLNRFKTKFLTDLLALGGIVLLFSTGLGKLLAAVKGIGLLAFQLTFTNILVKPFQFLSAFILGNITKFLNFIRLGVAGAFSFLKSGGGKQIQRGGSMLRNIGIAGGAGIFAGFFDKIKARLGFKPKGGKLPKGKVPGFGFLNALAVFGYVLEGINDFNESKARGNNNFQAFAEAATRVATDIGIYLGAIKLGTIAGAKIGGGIGFLIGSIFPGIGNAVGAAAGASVGGFVGGLLAALGLYFPESAEKIIGFNPAKLTEKIKDFTGGLMNFITGAKRKEPVLESSKKMNEERNKKRGTSFNKDEGFRFGGIIKAPASGAFVKLHGLEEIRPLDADGLMKNAKISSLSFDTNVANIIDLTSSSQKMNNQIGATPSSDVSAATVPTIPSSDYKNNFPAQAERYFNVVPV